MTDPQSRANVLFETGRDAARGLVDRLYDQIVRLRDSLDERRYDRRLDRNSALVRDRARRARRRGGKALSRTHAAARNRAAGVPARAASIAASVGTFGAVATAVAGSTAGRLTGGRRVSDPVVRRRRTVADDEHPYSTVQYTLAERSGFQEEYKYVSVPADGDAPVDPAARPGERSDISAETRRE